MAIKDSRTIPERMEKHQDKNWFDHGFNHKTTLTMGSLVPLGIKEVYPGELAKCYAQLMYRFAALYLPIMHQVYHTIDWFYVRNAALFNSNGVQQGFEAFMKQDPINGTVSWAYDVYSRANAVFTDGVYNYMGFNAPPGSGTLILQTNVSAIPGQAYFDIWHWFYRNPNIQTNVRVGLVNGVNTAGMNVQIPDRRVLKRNWPRDYYTIATLTPQQGANVLIPSFEGQMDPYFGQDMLPLTKQRVLNVTTGVPEISTPLGTDGSGYFNNTGGSNVVLELSSTIRDFRVAAQLTEFLERATRAGAGGSTDGREIRWSDWVKRYFDWDPNPLMIDQPVWIGGYTGTVNISDVMSTAEAGTQKVGDYAGKAMARDNTPAFTYKIPDYGVIIPVISVYPKASYYTGVHKMWHRMNKLDYMFEQFQFIGDQPMKNKEVWFSWYDADIAWNDEIFGYVPQYHSERYSNDIVSGQMRTLWESFHLGRKFAASTDVVLNSDFIECTPDVGRVFVIDAEAGEHECFLHAYVGIEIQRRLAKNAIPSL